MEGNTVSCSVFHFELHPPILGEIVLVITISVLPEGPGTWYATECFEIDTLPEPRMCCSAQHTILQVSLTCIPISQETADMVKVAAAESKPYINRSQDREDPHLPCK